MTTDYLRKRKAEILALWRANRLTYIEAVRALIDLGIEQEAAHLLVAHS